MLLFYNTSIPDKIGKRCVESRTQTHGSKKHEFKKGTLGRLSWRQSFRPALLMNDDRQIIRCLNETPQEVRRLALDHPEHIQGETRKETGSSSFDLLNMEQESCFFFFLFFIMFKAGKPRQKNPTKHCGKSCVKISLLIQHFFFKCLQGFLWRLTRCV